MLLQYEKNELKRVGMLSDHGCGFGSLCADVWLGLKETGHKKSRTVSEDIVFLKGCLMLSFSWSAYLVLLMSRALLQNPGFEQREGRLQMPAPNPDIEMQWKFLHPTAKKLIRSRTIYFSLLCYDHQGNGASEDLLAQILAATATSSSFQGDLLRWRP